MVKSAAAIRWLLLKDLRILRRSPLIVALLVLYPIVLAALIGLAVTSGPGKPRVALVNEVPLSAATVNLGGENVDLARESRPLYDSIHAVRVSSEAEAIKRVRDGDVLAALVLPGDIAQKLAAASSGGGSPATVRVYYSAEDPAKKAFVSDTIRARVQDANSALTKRVSQVALRYLDLIGRGGQFSFFGRSFDVLGLARAQAVLQAAGARLPARSPLRAQLAVVAAFAGLARANLGLAGPLLQSIGTPIKVDTRVVGGGAAPLGAFAAAVATTVTLMFVTLLVAGGALALEREENAYGRLVRGLVTRSGLIVEKAGLAAICSSIVGLILVIGLGLFLKLPWGRFPLWLLALAFGALAFGALGTAMGALAREVRAASLLAFMLSLPVAVLALVPSGAVSGGLHSVARAISALLPFRPTLDALDAALGRSGSIGLPLLHLALLTAAFGLLARLGLRRLDA
ncbi:MAG: hypothetical protein NVSMB25_00690 [Thermoleophilaceae bacterium]